MDSVLGDIWVVTFPPRSPASEGRALYSEAEVTLAVEEVT